MTLPATEHARTDPVIVLALPDSGADRLLSLLSASGELACTSWTGVLPLCDQAAKVWRQVENGNGPAGKTSALAAASIRAAITPLVTQILLGSGGRRWCELAVPGKEAAETFLGLFPGTRLVCLHREASEVMRAATARSPWGLAGPTYRAFVAAHPGSTVAALAAYWVTHTQALLEFERAHPQACLRVRFEDLPGPPGGMPEALGSFLGLAAAGYPGPSLRENGTQPAPHDEDIPPLAALPLDQIPPALLAQLNALLSQLGYPALGPG
jgi:hypothetical protein